MSRYLFVIDYQNDFVDGALGFPGAEKLDAGIAAKVRAYGQGRVLFTRDTHFDNYLTTREGQLLPVVHCIKGMDVTDPATAAVLPEAADEIELVGLVSNICVVSNACVLQAKYPEARIIVDASLTASMDPAMHEKVLDVLEGFQVKVINR